MENYQLVKRSDNGKTGHMPTSNSNSSTCPSACPFKDNGCYAQAGFHTMLNWRKVDNGERGKNWQGFIEDVKQIKPNTVWRHNVSGDLPGVDNDIDAIKLAELVDASRHARGFTYTHKPMTPANQESVKQANDKGFTINLSANNLAHADELKALNVAPVTVVVTADSPLTQFTPAGNKVIVCPAQRKDNVTCASCKLCAIADRKVIVGFQVHGNQSKKALKVIS